jgi:Peptidase family M28/PA domain
VTETRRRGYTPAMMWRRGFGPAMMWRRGFSPTVRGLAALACVSAVLAAAGVRAAADPKPALGVPKIAGAQVRAHVEFLADDLLEGREAGTRGYDLAAHYVATVLKSAGLKPAADDGTYFQRVPLRRSTLSSSALSLTSKSGGPATEVKIPDEGVVLSNHNLPSVSVTGDVVFAGYGVTAPEISYDDYAGIDVTGKVVLAAYNAPAKLNSEIRAHYASAVQKLKNAANHGAAGIIFMFTPEDQQRIPWEYAKARMTEPGYTTMQPDGKAFLNEPRMNAVAYVNNTGAQKLFAGASTSMDDAIASIVRGEPKSFALPIAATIEATTAHSDAMSANVVARLEGSDPALAKTSVLLTAHLDGVGVGQEVDGDRINNGAYDNATGSAILLEVARALGGRAQAPKRSVLVVFVTGEEKGLLGSDYFARHPVKAAGQMIADVNLDMPVFMTPSNDLVAFGSENSTLDAVVKRAAEAEGYVLSPDPMPEENIFVRSDQYSFVKQGVPSVYLMPGFTPIDPKSTTPRFEEFRKKHYHKPSDDLSLPMDLDALARFTRANYRVIATIADDPVAPSWKPGNFFGKMFGKGTN